MNLAFPRRFVEFPLIRMPVDYGQLLLDKLKYQEVLFQVVVSFRPKAEITIQSSSHSFISLGGDGGTNS
jgi:hypothetical protein